MKRRVIRTRLGVACLGAALVATAATTPAAAVSSTMDGPGTYVLFRTLPETAAPSAAQNQACDDHFGPRSSTVVLRQAAISMVPRVDKATGFAVDELAGYVGPSYICAAPGLNADLTEAYANADLPVGRAEGSGSCAVSLPSLVRAAPFLGCRVALGPVPSIGSPGGYAVTNTVSGSIIVGYLARNPSAPLPYTPPPAQPPHNTLPNDPDFYLWRTFGAQSGASMPDCQRAGALLPSGAQKFSLSATQPDLDTGALDPAEQITGVGQVTVCFTGGNADRRSALAVAKFRRDGATVTANAAGDCRTAALPGRTDVRVQTCTLSVLWAGSPLFRAAHLSSIGLVRADNPLVAANSHVFSLGILDGSTKS